MTPTLSGFDRVLVTGSSGFIGRRVVAQLERAGATVIGVSRSPGATMRVDVTDARQVEELFEHVCPDAVVHLAATIPETSDALADRVAFEECVAGSVNIVEACRRIEAPLVHASSTAVYGRMSGEVPAVESALPVPESLYGAGKLVGDLLVLQLADGREAPASALRISAPYGPGNPRLSVVNRFLAAALASEDLMLYGSGSRAQDFTFVDDVAEAVVHALSSDARGLFNVASGRPVSMRALADAVLEAVPATRSKVRLADRDDPQDAYRAVIDVTKARVELGWIARTGLLEGLTATAAALQ